MEFFPVQCFIVMSVCFSVPDSYTSVPTKHLDPLREESLVWPMSIRTHLNNQEHSWTYIIGPFIKHFRTDRDPLGIEQNSTVGWTPRPRPAIVHGTAPLRPGPSDRVGKEWDREGWARGKFRNSQEKSEGKRKELKGNIGVQEGVSDKSDFICKVAGLGCHTSSLPEVKILTCFSRDG